MHEEIITHFKYLNTIIDEITHLRLFKNEYEQILKILISKIIN